MSSVRALRPGYVIIYPNRAKAASQATQAIVVVILLMSVALMLIVTIGGWSKLQGMLPVNFLWCIAYLVIAVYVVRWKRGVLPMAAALAVLLFGLAIIAGLGIGGPSWFDRNNYGFAAPRTLFGGRGLSPDLLGVATLLIAPVQVLLVIFSLQAFAQGWNVEQEVPEEEAKRRGLGPGSPERPAVA